MNPFLAFFDGQDQNGGYLRNYRLTFDVGLFSILSQGLSLMLHITYAAFLLPIGAIATWLMGFVFEPGRVLDPATEWYHNLFDPVLQVVPPMVIASVCLGILVLYIVFDRTTNSRSLSEDFERLGVGVLLAVLVGFLVANPFRVMTWILDLVPRVMRELNEGASADSMTGNVVGSLMAPLTQMVNYGEVLDNTCSAEWSAAMNSGSEPSCVDSPTSINAGTLAVVFIGIGVTMLMLVFALIIGIKFMYHLTIGMLNWVGLVYYAAVSIARRRQFDALSKGVQRAMSHTIMAVILSSFAMIGVAILVGVVGELSTSSMVPAMMAYVIGFLILIVLAVKLSASHGALARGLRAETDGFFRQKLGAPGPARFGGGGGSGDAMEAKARRFGQGASRLASQGTSMAANSLMSRMGGRTDTAQGEPVMQRPDSGSPGFVADHAAATPYQSRSQSRRGLAKQVTREGGMFRNLVTSGVGAAAGAAALYFSGGNPAAAGAAKTASTAVVDTGFDRHDRKVSTAQARSDAVAARYAAAGDAANRAPGSTGPGSPQGADTVPVPGQETARGNEYRDGGGVPRPTDTGALPVVAGTESATVAAGGTEQPSGPGQGQVAPQVTEGRHRTTVEGAGAPGAAAAPGAGSAGGGVPVPLTGVPLPRATAIPAAGTSTGASGPLPTAPQGPVPAQPARTPAEIVRSADIAASRASRDNTPVVDLGDDWQRHMDTLRRQDAELPVPSRMDGSPSVIGPETSGNRGLTEGERGMSHRRVEEGYRQMRWLCSAEGVPVVMSPAEEDCSRVVLQATDEGNGGQAVPVGRSVFG